MSISALLKLHHNLEYVYCIWSNIIIIIVIISVVVVVVVDMLTSVHKYISFLLNHAMILINSYNEMFLYIKLVK
mgnify:FL=1